MHLHFLSFIIIEMVHVIEIFPHGRQGPVYCGWPMPWLLMAW